MKAYLNTRVLAVVFTVTVMALGYVVMSTDYDKCMANSTWAVCSR